MLDELVAAVLTNGVVALSSLQAPKRAADRSAPLKAKEIREILCISKKSLFYLFKFIFADPFLQVNFSKTPLELPYIEMSRSICHPKTVRIAH